VAAPALRQIASVDAKIHFIFSIASFSLDRPPLRLRPRAREIVFNPAHDVGVGRRDIPLLVRILAKVVQLERRCRLQAHCLPVGHPDGLLEPTLVEFPVHEVVRGLFPAAQRARHRDPIQAAWRFGAAQLRKCRQHVPVRPQVVADAIRRYRPYPARDHRYADASFVQIALDPAQAAGALEECWIGAAFTMRTIVADEQDQRLPIDLALADQIDEAADVAIHTLNHGDERRTWRRLRAISQRRRVNLRARLPGIRFLVHERLLRKLSVQRLQRIRRNAKLGVGHCVVEIDEERAPGVL
jgi:hypothetical protein